MNLGIGLPPTPALPIDDEIVKREEDIKVEERHEDEEERGPRTIQGRKEGEPSAPNGTSGGRFGPNEMTPQSSVGQIIDLLASPQ